MNNDHGIRVYRPWSTAGRNVPIAPPEPWTEAALCLQVDPEMFFPEQGGSTRPAKRICSLCEVRNECLAWALEHDGPYPYGVYGGLSAIERIRLTRRRAS